MMSHSLPTLVLTVAGTVLVFLGLFAAGDIGLVAMGLGAVAAAGVLHLAQTALHRRDSKG